MTEDATSFTGLDLAREFLSASPFANHLGLRLVTISPDYAELLLPFSQSVVTIGDVVHGGAVSSLVDTAATVAAWAVPGPPPATRGSTVGLTVTFVAAARGQDLLAAARVVRRGRSLCFCDVEVTDGPQRPVAKGLVTYRIG